MHEMLEHPDITCALRTGYPRRRRRSWIMEDDCEEQYDEDALYEERRDAEHGWE